MVGGVVVSTSTARSFLPFPPQFPRDPPKELPEHVCAFISSLRFHLMVVA